MKRNYGGVDFGTRRKLKFNATDKTSARVVVAIVRTDYSRLYGRNDNVRLIRNGIVYFFLICRKFQMTEKLHLKFNFKLRKYRKAED